MRLRALLLCALCGIARGGEDSAAAVANTAHPEVDYAPLRAAVARVMTTPRHAPCVIPERAVVLTYTNTEMFPLLLLQRRAMQLGGVRRCLQRRFITVCLDAECLQLCTRFHVPNCVDLGIQTVASTFLENDYQWITYIKHEIMAAGLQGGADELFFFDGDVALFGDPWSAKLQDSTGNFDLRYQVDNLSAQRGQCQRGVNSGQVYLRRTNTTLAYLDAMLGFRDKILSATTGGHTDQDFIAAAAEQTGLQHCGLDPAAFVGKCHGCSELLAGGQPVSSPLTLHIDCSTGAKVKKQILTKFLAVRTAVAELEAHGLTAPVTIKQALIC